MEVTKQALVNWCYNRLELTVKNSADADLVKSWLGGYDSSSDAFQIDFNVISPLPPELEGITHFKDVEDLSTYTIERYNHERIGALEFEDFIYQAKLRDLVSLDLLDDIHFYFEKADMNSYAVEDIVEQSVRCYSNLDDVPSILYELLMLIQSDNNMYCRKTHGCKKYMWAFSNWGTKWNASNTSFKQINQKDSIKLISKFQTAWSEPVQWFMALCRLIEKNQLDIKATLSYGEIGEYFGGEYTFMPIQDENSNELDYDITHRMFNEIDLHDFFQNEDKNDNDNQFSLIDGIAENEVKTLAQ